MDNNVKYYDAEARFRAHDRFLSLRATLTARPVALRGLPTQPGEYTFGRSRLGGAEPSEAEKIRVEVWRDHPLETAKSAMPKNWVAAKELS
jgi:hypothetical protein